MNIRAIGKPALCKLLRVDAELDDGIVRTISIRGDFFAIPEEGFDRVEARLAGTPLDKLAERFDELMSEEGVEPYGINGRGLLETITEAVDGARL